MSKLAIILRTQNSTSKEGCGVLQDALDSLQNQTFIDFQLCTLDNDSSEMKKFKLINSITTKYIMMANYDNLWNYYYIESLLKIFEKHPKIALAYSNGTFISKDGVEKGPLLKNTKFTYNSNIEQNFCYAIRHRNIIPLLFGIFRTDVYKNIIELEQTDEMFLAKLFLAGHKAQLYNVSLLHHREHKHDLLVDNNTTQDNPTLIWVYNIQQQLEFYKKVIYLIDNNKPLLKIVTLDSCLQYLGLLLKWIINNLTKDMFEKNLLQTIYIKYIPIQNILIKADNPKISNNLYKNHYKKCIILSTQILPYIVTMLSPNKIIINTIKLVQEIQSEIL